MGKSDFLAKFEEMEDGTFTPKDQSQNWCRHFGVKKDKRLHLYPEEMLYLYDRNPKEEYSVRTKAYFFIRNNCYNLLLGEDGRFLLYRRHKNFNRKKDKPICLMRYVHRDEWMEDSTKDIVDESFCVLSDDVFTFLRIRKVLKLGMDTPENLRKWDGEPF
ncbi:hypothetical protein P7C65_07s2g11450 [Encephalitozoon intestinalis]